MNPAPAKVSRVGGAVRTFDTPRVVWKKAHLPDRECLVKMALPPGEQLVYPAKPSHSWNSAKLRASACRVLAIEELAGGPAPETTAEAPHVKGFVYHEGERVIPDEFSADPSVSDAPGIHCFATRVGARYWGGQGFDPARATKVVQTDAPGAP